jgi:LemA protein
MSSQVLEIIRIRKELSMRAWSLAFAVMVLLAVPGCGYNGLQRQDEDVRAAWSDVLDQYQRRAELVPNLVRTVKGYANRELQVLIGVTEARAEEAGSIQLTPELVNNPQAFAKFQVAQGQLSGALKNLFAVTEAYPQLQSDANFRDLQVALEGTESRIAAARNLYIDTVRNYNVTVRSFPRNLTAKMFDFQVKPNFVANEQSISVAPTVDFGDSPTKHPARVASGQPVRK